MKNLDGIQKSKKYVYPKIKAVKISSRIVLADSVKSETVRIKPLKPAESLNFKTQFFARIQNKIKFKIFAQSVLGLRIKQQKYFLNLFKNFSRNARLLFNSQYRIPLTVAVVALFIAFSGGMWAAWSTPKSQADSNTDVGSYAMPIESNAVLGPINNISNEVLFNMTISQLEGYLSSLAESNRQVKAAEILALRKSKLRTYLESKKSPFSKASDVIAEQEHWKLILAISFAESTFGKNCVDNNCSNIGVKPGHPAWRKYATLRDWVISFNSLLDRKYKNWSLEQMNGVYVQPKNNNWMLATRQILEELQELGIE